MATPADRIEQELRRKARLGIQPTDPNNMQRYNQIRAQLQQGQTQPTRTTAQSQSGNQSGFWSNLARRAGSAITNALTNAASANQMPTSADRFYSQTEAIRRQLSQQATPFSYNPEDDPQYQAALRQAQRNAQTAAGDIAAEMNRRGLLNSTITQDRSDQAAQREYARVSDTLLPQLMQQAYNRYLNEQNARRQAIMDQLDILGTQYDLFTGERDYSDTQRAAEAETRRLEREANWNAYRDVVNWTQNLGTGPKEDWQLLISEAHQGAPTLEAQKFQEDIRQFGIDAALKQAGLEQDAQQFAQRMGLDWAQLNQRQKEFVADQAWRAKNYELDVTRERRISNEANTPNVGDYKMSPDWAADYQWVLNNPSQAATDLQRNAQAFINAYGYDGYQALLSALPQPEE